MHAEPSLNVAESVSLAPLTTLGIGGPAKWLAIATVPAHVPAAHARARQLGLPMFVLGGGSNLVIADGGFPGLVLRVAIMGTTTEENHGVTRVHVGAGEIWDDLVATVVRRGLAGVECLSGIPGTVGGTPIQNVGAYGQEVSETIESVTAYDLSSSAMVTLPAAECGFSYRMSRFKREPGRFVVTNVTLRLTPGAPTVRYPDLRAWHERAGVAHPTLDDVRRAVIAVRRTKGMVVDPDDPDSRSVGSFFMNPIVSTSARERIASLAGEMPPTFAAGADTVKVPAAWLIERSGIRKGHVDGAVGISTKHPLALINRGGARAGDVVRLATHIKHEVANRFDVRLRPEPNFVGFEGDAAVEYLLHE
jgi:UDP-N-acetylmuramate dehydrogenase